MLIAAARRDNFKNDLEGCKVFAAWLTQYHATAKHGKIHGDHIRHALLRDFRTAAEPGDRLFSLSASAVFFTSSLSNCAMPNSAGAAAEDRGMRSGGPSGWATLSLAGRCSG